MKTTVEIADPLLKRAKSIAAREGVSLRALVEEGLRRVVDARRGREQFRLRKATFRGQGLQPAAAEGGWPHVRELIYQGRGG